MLVPWVIFIVFVLLMLALDLGVFHRKSHSVKVKEALIWSGVWISLGLAFSALVYQAYNHHWFDLGLETNPAVIAERAVAEGRTDIDLANINPHEVRMVAQDLDGQPLEGRHAAIKYLTGYVVEKSLSVDNIFVIAMIFTALRVRPRYQHRVLYWGILGALVMRGAMIGIGATLIHNFHWILYIFGAFLIFTGIKMALPGDNELDDVDDHFLNRWIRKIAPVTQHYHGRHFLVRAGTPASLEAADPDEAPKPDPVVASAKAGARLFTPLFVALMLVEFTDLIFAVDSIPAIFAITADPFLVFTSNVFAILGLRSLYFALAGVIDKFRYLKPALALILTIVGVKMLTAHWLKDFFGSNFNFIVLGVILGILAIATIASIIAEKRSPKA